MKGDLALSINMCDSQPFTKIIKKRELILLELKNRGCRITKQRMMILDIILEKECTCCKEIYYRASRVDQTIGIATVYRMLKTLEEIGAIDRKNLYRISYDGVCELHEGCMILLKNKEKIQLTSSDWNEVLKAGLKAKGFIEEDDIDAVIMKSCYA